MVPRFDDVNNTLFFHNFTEVLLTLWVLASCNKSLFGGNTGRDGKSMRRHMQTIPCYLLQT